MKSMRSLLQPHQQRLLGTPHQYHQRIRIATTQLQTHQDFFRYTSGRWLWDEDARLKERYREFNVSALQQAAASSVAAGHCVSMEKLAEGGSNRIFRLVMDDGSVVIARIPIQDSGPLFYTVASEVATMDFVSRILEIPVPKVLSWEPKADNPVQSEYILMEEASGHQLGNIWSSMDVEAKAEVVAHMVSIANKLLSVSFSRYGSIYFSANRFPGCEPAVVSTLCEEEKIAAVTNRYVIGPVTERSFWDGERAEFSGVHGPWNSAQEYLQAIAIREITWLSKHANLQEKKRLPFQPLTRTSPQKHIALYQKFLAASGHLLPADPGLVRPTLWHWDMHAPNIFVTGNRITSIIDWQDCWAGPLMLQAQRPPLVDFRGELKLQLPPQYQDLEEGPEKKQIRSDVEKSLLLFSYESDIQRANPALDRLFRLPQASTIRDTVLFAANSWHGGFIPFRESLMRIFRQVYRHWKELCPNQECPFTFTQDELDTGTDESASWNANAEFWSSISGLVGRDGFVLVEDYDEALEMFARLREDALRTLQGHERAEFEQATMWASRSK